MASGKEAIEITYSHTKAMTKTCYACSANSYYAYTVSLEFFSKQCNPCNINVDTHVDILDKPPDLLGMVE